MSLKDFLAIVLPLLSLALIVWSLRDIKCTVRVVHDYTRMNESKPSESTQDMAIMDAEEHPYYSVRRFVKPWKERRARASMGTKNDTTNES